MVRLLLIGGIVSLLLGDYLEGVSIILILNIMASFGLWNDAIALKESDIGLAMGNGTDVAREAADVVLMDSRFSTIPSAVEEGRNVLHRIRLYLSYILSGNGCEVGLFIVAYVLNIPIPLTALVLLVINFATDSFPALAMAFEPGEKDVMARPPGLLPRVP